MKKDSWILVLITAIAIVARLFGLDFEPLSPEQKASVILSVSAGVLSVIGLYLLVKELFDEKLAALSSFLLAISFWHVLISKLGAKDVLTSFTLIFAFYFMWHGLKYSRTFDFFMAGLFGGTGFYVGKVYLVAPLVVLLVFWNYWDYIKKDFSLSKYEQAKTSIIGGFSLLVLITMAVVLPVGFYIWQNPAFLLSIDNSVFAGLNPLTQIRDNLGWVTDKILLIEFGGKNLISWPLSIFFTIGFIKEFIHWVKRKHGHFSVVHTLIFSWLFIMPVPVLLSADEPSVLGASIVLPPIIILSAKSIWWVMEKLNRWNHLVYPRPHKHWVRGEGPVRSRVYVGLDAGPMLALIALLLSIAILEISKLV